MLPLLLLAGVAALTAMGCAENIESPGPRSSNKPPPPPDYPDQFGDDENAKWVRLQLKLKGITDPELDRGCPTYRYFQDGSFERFFEGREDKKISSCEGYESALDHYEKYPEIAEAIAGKPIPWSLDDRNPATSIDRGFREQVQGAIHHLDQLLKKEGIQPGSVAYQEGMVVGLFYFSAVPNSEQLQARKEEIARLEATSNKSQKEKRELEKKIWKLQYHQSNIQEIEGEMAHAKVAEYMKFHQKNEGFYFERQDEPPQEYNALEALRKKSGECTELSKILFAVLKMAGLSPAFVDVDLLKSEDPYVKRALLEDQSAGHVCIGITIGNRFILLDPSLIKLQPSHRVYFPLTLREYLAVDIYDYALSTKGMKLPEMMNLTYKALQLDPNSFSAWSARAFLRTESKDWKGAIEYYTRAIEIYPLEARQYFYRGWAWKKMGNIESAEADFNQAIARYPNFWSAHVYRGFLFLDKNERTKAREDFIQALNISPQKASPEIVFGLVYRFNSELKNPKMEQVVNTILDEAKLGQADAKAKIAVAALLWEMDQRQMARDAVQGEIVEAALQGKDELEKEKKRFSQVTVKFLMSLFRDLPPAMQQDPEILAGKKSLGLRGKP